MNDLLHKLEAFGDPRYPSRLDGEGFIREIRRAARRRRCGYGEAKALAARFGKSPESVRTRLHMVRRGREPKSWSFAA